MRGVRNILLASGLCFAAAGCPDNDEPSDVSPQAERPYAGLSIRIAAPQGLSFDASWRGPLTEWSTQTGAQFELTEYDPAAALDALFAAEEGAALAVFPLARLGELLDAAALAAIPEGPLRDPEGVAWNDLFAGLRDGLGSPGKRPTLVPLACPVLLCYYRQDLLEGAGLAPPETWADYQRLLDRLEAWAPGLSAVEPWGTDFRATMFLARSAAFARHPGHYSLFFDIDTGAPLIDQPGFVRGLETAQAAWDRLAPDCKTLSPADCRQRMLDGRAALAIACEPLEPAEPLDAAHEESPARPDDERIGLCRLPGSPQTYNPTRQAWDRAADKGVYRVTLCGFDGLALAGSARRPAAEVDAAWNAVSRRVASGTLPGAVELCRESQVSAGPSRLTGALRADEAAACVEAIAESLRQSPVVAELPVLRRDEFRAALSAALGDALEGRTGPAEALAQTATAWRKLAEELGPERLRRGYRAALGLSAR